MSKALRIFVSVAAMTFKVLFSLVALSIPVLGVWLATSLAAFLNGPIWLPLVCGLFFFPVIPLSWDLWATKRFKRRVLNTPAHREAPVRYLTFWDRLIVRTIAVNLALLSVLAIGFPEKGFLALSTRGDWMLENATGGWVEPTQEALFVAAGGLEWLYKIAVDNPYEEFADPETVAPSRGTSGQLETVIPAQDEGTKPEKERAPKEQKESTKTESDKKQDEDPGRVEKDKKPEKPADKPRAATTWPPPQALHPLVANMPADAQESIASVAKYILDNESDPFYRVKALFDFVANHVTYDVAALTGYRPPQDAETVFRTGMGVCAGYAYLLRALGEETGDEIVYVVGISRNLEGEVGGGGHAWNAARIEENWYLMDPTWGAGHLKGDKFVRSYNPAYLFTPPKVLLNTHFPNDEGWQLLEEPISRGEFLRQPVLRAPFFANGMNLIDPNRSQINVQREAKLTFENPRARFLMASARPKGKPEAGKDCKVTQGPRPLVHCDLPDPGTYQIVFFGNEQRYGSYNFWGQIEVHNGT